MDKKPYGQYYVITDVANRVPFWLKVNLKTHESLVFKFPNYLGKKSNPRR